MTTAGKQQELLIVEKLNPTDQSVYDWLGMEAKEAGASARIFRLSPLIAFFQKPPQSFIPQDHASSAKANPSDSNDAY